MSHSDKAPHEVDVFADAEVRIKATERFDDVRSDDPRCGWNIRNARSWGNSPRVRAEVEWRESFLIAGNSVRSWSAGNARRNERDPIERACCDEQWQSMRALSDVTVNQRREGCLYFSHSDGACNPGAFVGVQSEHGRCTWYIESQRRCVIHDDDRAVTRKVVDETCQLLMLCSSADERGDDDREE